MRQSSLWYFERRFTIDKMLSSDVSFVVVFTLLLTVTEGWKWPMFGRCPQLTVKQNFSLENYLGTWYQQASVNTDFEGKGRCISATYSNTSSSNLINLVNTKITPSNTLFTMEGTAVLQDPSKKEGRLIVTLPAHFLWLKFVGPYWILDTDYESYAVVYGCSEFLWLFHDYAVILFSRTQDLSNDKELENQFYNQTYQVLFDNNLNPTDFEVSNNSNCTL